MTEAQEIVINAAWAVKYGLITRTQEIDALVMVEQSEIENEYAERWME